MNKYFLLSFLFFGFLWSCSDSELITPGDEFLTVIDPGTYTVDVDGATEDFSYVTQAINDPAESQINGTAMSGKSISISLTESLSTGVHSQIDGARITLNLGADGIFTNIAEDGTALPLNISISQVNNNLGIVSGSFDATVFNVVTGATKILTNGNFYMIEFEPTVSNDRILKADFNGTAFDFSSEAKASGIATAAIISGFNVNQIQNLSINIPGGIAVGTYTEENNVVVRVQLGTSNDPNDYYTNYNATTDEYLPFTLNVTQITADVGGRVLGNFTGTITKFVNGQATEEIEITNGVINVPVVVTP
jgi:hypothetical protein